MTFLIVEILFFLSLIGIIGLAFKKIPELNKLPAKKVVNNKNDHIINLKNKMVEMNPLGNISSDVVLQKILSKIRVTNLKIENKTSKLLSKIRRKNHQKKKKLRKGKDYWKEVRNATKKEEEKPE